MTRRLFLAVDLPDGLMGELEHIRHTLSGGCRAVRWTRSENLHATVLFLGNVDDAVLAELKPSLAGACGMARPFSLTTRGLVPGPPGRRASMIWLGFEDSPAFGRLAAGCHDSASRSLGLPPLRLDAAPHVTLARSRDGLSGRCLEELGNVGLKYSFDVEGVTLYESHLDQGGPTYDILDSYTLDKTTDA